MHEKQSLHADGRSEEDTLDRRKEDRMIFDGIMRCCICLCCSSVCADEYDDGTRRPVGSEGGCDVYGSCTDLIRGTGETADCNRFGTGVQRLIGRRHRHGGGLNLCKYGRISMEVFGGGG